MRWLTGTGRSSALADGNGPQLRLRWSLSLELGLLFGLELGAVVEPHLRGAVHCVEDAEVAIVALELLVVEVVEVGLLVWIEVPRQPEARVVDLRADDGGDDPHERKEGVRVRHDQPGAERHDVGEHKLDRVAVDCDERDGRGELVVLLLGGTVRWRARGEQQRARCVARAPLSNSGRGLARAL